MAKRTFTVTIHPKVEKGFDKLPLPVLEALISLVKDLQDRGPIQGRWHNFSKLSKPNTYHCHLKHDYSACWRTHGKNKEEIEVYYAGRREKAPY